MGQKHAPTSGQSKTEAIRCVAGGREQQAISKVVLILPTQKGAFFFFPSSPLMKSDLPCRR